MHGGYDDMEDEWLTPKWRWDQYGGGDDVWSKHPSATNSRTLVSPNPRLLHFCTNWHTTIHMGCQQMQSLIHTSHFYPEGLPQVVQCKETPRLNFHETKVPAPRFSKTCSGRHWGASADESCAHLVHCRPRCCGSISQSIAHLVGRYYLLIFIEFCLLLANAHCTAMYAAAISGIISSLKSTAHCTLHIAQSTVQITAEHNVQSNLISVKG